MQTDPHRLNLNDISLIQQYFKPENDYVFMGYDISNSSPDFDQDTIKQNTVFCVGRAFKGCINYNQFYEYDYDIKGFYNCSNSDLGTFDSQRTEFNKYFNNPFEDGTLDSSNFENFNFYAVAPTGEEILLNVDEIMLP